MDGNVRLRHFYSLCGIKKSLLRLLQALSKIRSRMQSGVTLVMDHSLEEVMICTFVTIHMLINHTVILHALIDFLRIILMNMTKPGTFLLVTINL